MLIISTRPVATSIHAVSAPSIFAGSARTGVALDANTAAAAAPRDGGAANSIVSWSPPINIPLQLS